jgi:hypothetical protein
MERFTTQKNKEMEATTDKKQIMAAYHAAAAEADKVLAHAEAMWEKAKAERPDVHEDDTYKWAFISGVLKTYLIDLVQIGEFSGEELLNHSWTWKLKTKLQTQK